MRTHAIGERVKRHIRGTWCYGTVLKKSRHGHDGKTKYRVRWELGGESDEWGHALKSAGPKPGN